MNPRALMLPAVPLLLAGVGWWGADSLVKQAVKPQTALNVPQITLPAGIEALAPVSSRPPLGFLELTAFGFTIPPKKVVIRPRVLTAADLYVVDSVLKGDSLDTAMIGNKPVKVGDKLGGRYTVLSVVSDGVWVKGSRKRDKQEKIGFRPYVAVTEESEKNKTNNAASTAVAAPAKPVSAGPEITPGQRDFRQILETLKL